MIDNMIKKLAKRYVIGKVNDLLDANKSKIETTKEVVAKWIRRIERILTCLKSVLVTLDDNKIETDELKANVEEITEVVKSW